MVEHDQSVSWNLRLKATWSVGRTAFKELADNVVNVV